MNLVEMVVEFQVDLSPAQRVYLRDIVEAVRIDERERLSEKMRDLPSWTVIRIENEYRDALDRATVFAVLAE